MNITDAILADNEHSYGGSWAAAWGFDDHSGSGVITANVARQSCTSISSAAPTQWCSAPLVWRTGLL